ncbi:class II aldolase/adducin family protein [Accumulibacter sp.]|uniref:class II aldolase/adducin family protein n=1 Tax=Accumulibacter sp. TaxID=2053492 RepID=UPI0025D1F47A|nr:class II aldolase/adducin family protein [Accumulibacter sp.]MCM8596667.1 class II aldolase/adducin family protein [Accumulibacter sp.]MCM8627665.1 class II aldolase/adducin family protein [Accumulibacter sp.]MDS4050815.1 class II aldolase/adducin family protein [Accumulibacter sp.]
MVELTVKLIEIARATAAAGLSRGTAGNLSVRAPEGSGSDFLITPSGMACDTLTPEDICTVHFDGSCEGVRKPSSEWRVHRDLYATRPDAGAIVHAHPPFATSLSCLRRDIPPFHYMVARFGGHNIRCSDYATFGTQALSYAVLRAIEKRRGCLMANHGMIVAGQDLRHAFDLAIELEALCEQYWRACQLGPPVLLEPEEMAAVSDRFAGYGQP